MNTSKNKIEGTLMKMMLGVVATAVFGLAGAPQTPAQTTSTSTSTQPATTPGTTNYSFSVSVAKTVPNPCTGSATDVSGTTNFTVQATQGTSSFLLKVDSSSSGSGQDLLQGAISQQALSADTSTLSTDGTLSTDSTLSADSTFSTDSSLSVSSSQSKYDFTKSPYGYGSTTTSDATFSAKPSYVLQTLTVAEYLVRSVASTTRDSFVMRTVFEITFNDGVPAKPILRSITTKCATPSN